MGTPRNDLAAERLRELLHYNPETGVFTWIVTRKSRAKAGTQAGSCGDKKLYRVIYVDNKPYRACRLAFLYMTGAWPKEFIDHRNLNKSDDSWGNLREATRQQNSHNIPLRKDSTSGVRGVSWHKRERKWTAYITEPVTRRRAYIGDFKSFDEAAAARREAEMKLFGEFRCEAA